MGFFEPTPSADGKKIFVYGSRNRGELQRFDPKTKQFLPFLSGISVEGVDFSRDGQWVVYVTMPGGILWRSKVDGSQRLQLSFGSSMAALPRWSPDDRSVAFMSGLQSKTGTMQQWKIYVVPFDGGSPQALISTGAYRNETDPNWSPDGDSILFAGEAQDSESRPESNAIYMINRRIGKVEKLPSSEGIVSPRWSPDGQYIAAQSADQTKLLLFEMKTQMWKELGRWSPDNLNWSRDSRFIYMDIDVSGEKFLARLQIANHKLEKLFSLQATHRLYGFLGPWMGLDHDNNPMYLRDVGILEIFALDVELP